MTYKTIVVHVGGGARRRERLDIACNLAAAFDAHLVGLFALAEFLVPFALGGNGTEPELLSFGDRARTPFLRGPSPNSFPSARNANW